MCTTCRPIKSYENVNTFTQLSEIKEQASVLVNEGIFELLFEYSDDSYLESKFQCNHCGTTHVLWMAPDLCATGGEWRQL